MPYFESVPASVVRPGDELAYCDTTQYVESVLGRPNEVTIRWADPQEGTVTISKDERVHRVLKADSEEMKVRS